MVRNEPYSLPEFTTHFGYLIEKMSQNLLFAAIVIDTLRIK